MTGTPKRGKYARQQAWKDRTGFEQSPERRAKKAAWARASRAKKKAAKNAAEKAAMIAVVDTWSGLGAYEIWLTTNTGTHYDFLMSLMGVARSEQPTGDS